MNTVLFLLVLLAGLAGIAAILLRCRPAAASAAVSAGGSAGSAAIPYVRAAGLALILFWLLRTAAERRIGLGPAVLFSFLADGRLLPGRLAVLFLCVLFSLAYFLTSPGLRLRARLSRFAEKDGSLWLISLAVTALIVLWTLRVTVLSYMTNDDVYIIGTMVRTAENGLASAVTSFSHVLFCGMFAILYSLAPDVLWYLGYHVLALALSLVILGRCVLLKTRRLGWSTTSGLLMLSCVHGLFLYSFAELSFTVTPAVVGSAAIALILCRSDVPRRGTRAALDIVGAVLMLLCYMQRPVSGRCVLCFWGVACAYHLLRLFLDSPGNRVRRMLSFAPYILAVLLLLGGARGMTRSDTYRQSSEYATAEHYRSLVVDYLIDDITFEEYESVGIPQELAVMLHGWYFMDERITTETFRELVNTHYANNADNASPVSLIRQFVSSVLSDPQTAYRMAALLLLFLASLAALIRCRRKYLPAFLTALCACGGAAILWLYLVSEGRFPIRVFLVVYDPALTLVLLSALTAPDGSAPAPPDRERAGSVPEALIVFCFYIACILCVSIVPHIQESVSHDDVFAEEMAVERYVGEQPETTFITNIYETNLDPIHSTTYPRNKVLWGACGDTYRSDRLYADAFFRDDTLFLCQKPGYIQFLLQYLTLDFGPVCAEMKDHLIHDIVIYDVAQITPGEDYTGWYEQNGMTYYFENGQAVSGEKIIDGREYSFAPFGSASTLVIRDGDSTIYTTDAYSLISGEE